ncbi:receptor-like protein eix2 [Quercus suber]|uniref:Receptor-like protein eix2 n=1 Tax=Quercus suber TaxID=58331 RepID=A0AAW0IQF3_QUESU
MTSQIQTLTIKSIIIIAATLTLLLCLLTIHPPNFCTAHSNSEVRCIESDRHALLNFKQHLTDPSNRLASWASASDVDCCHWVGVLCDNRTGHVLQLHLRSYYPLGEELLISYAYVDFQQEAHERSRFGGKINPSLLDLKHLIYLDLSYNDFGGIQIPKFLGSMGSLRYLNLSHAGFVGLIPHQLGNLSNLQYLNLGDNYNNNYYYYYSLYVKNLQWLSGLPLLQHLDLSSANLSKASDWLQEINKLPSLLELRLSDCALSGFIPSPIPSSINFSSLTTLDLSDNSFENTSIPFWVFGLHNLVSLDLSDNQFQGPIPVHLQNLTSLRHLDLSYNQFQGPIPVHVQNLTSLSHLDLSHNQFQGPIPVHLQNLTSLRHLDLSDNTFNSSIPDWLYTFSHLEFLNLGSNYLQGTISSSIGNLTSAISIDLSYNELEGKVPRSLGNLCNLRAIILSGNKWSQEISEIFESLLGCASNGLEILDLSNAQLSGQLTAELGQFKNLVSLSLAYNSISGPIPFSIGNLSSLRSLYLESNQINGTFTQILGQLSKLESLNIGLNMLEGVVLEVHFVNSMRLKTLVASQNRLTLEVSDNWTPPFQLNHLDLGSWNLGPKFPLWLCSQRQLLTLGISNTRILDAVPPSFWNLTSQLTYLNISHNQIYGEIPHIPLILSSSEIIIDMSSNRFKEELCSLTSLQILDLSHNKLFGSIPKCVHNFSAMATSNSSDHPFFLLSWSTEYFSAPFESQLVVIKGKHLEYSTTLQLVKIIDLSNNNLSREIPEEVMHLKGLQSLNLSFNILTGRIPKNIGDMGSVESIDFSSNQLSGQIPQSMSSLTFLSRLNLSNNNLIGRIPSSTQLQSLNAFNFFGNKLCGPPLTDNCTIKDVQPNIENKERKVFSGLVVDWFYVFMALGFVVGFWVVLGPLLLNRQWRVLYFQFLDHQGYKLRGVVTQTWQCCKNRNNENDAEIVFAFGRGALVCRIIFSSFAQDIAEIKELLKQKGGDVDC